MKTPIVDFVKKYKESGMSRMHMPGHKGVAFLGCEPLDITEIKGADVLSEAEGIILESEDNASALFHTARTMYVTEGTSLSIKMMFFVALQAYYEKQGKNKNRPYVIAARNVHRAMIDACALLDFDVQFLQEEGNNTICTDCLSSEALEAVLKDASWLPIGVYVTSPDYLGKCSDIASLATVCHKYNIPLLVDNAHGAYLAFLQNNSHPIALGADLCCDSAHKTLPVLTGGAYFHCAESMKSYFEEYAGKAMALFGSTSPSYLIMQSLDLCNRYLADGYKERLAKCVQEIHDCKIRLQGYGIAVEETEPLKIVIDAITLGITGEALAEELREFQLECEYADDQYVVFMLTPENTQLDYERIMEWAKNRKKIFGQESIHESRIDYLEQPIRKCTIREAVLSKAESISVLEAEGRICAAETVSCPPAIPIVISGEVITKNMIQLFEKYHIDRISVVCES